MVKIIVSFFFNLFLYAEIKVAYIDSQRILKEYKEAQEAQMKIEEEISRWKLKLDSLKQVYLDKEKEYESQEPMLSDEAKLIRQKELKTLKMQYEQYAQMMGGKEGIEQKTKEIFDPIIKTIAETIEKIAKEKGYTIILDIASGAILYGEPELNLTDEVIAELNRKYAPITLPLIPRKIAIMNIVAKDEPTRQEGFSRDVISGLEAAIKNISEPLRLNLLPAGEVNSMLSKRGLSPDIELRETDIYLVGVDLDADFAIAGSVIKIGEGAEITLSLYAPKLSQKLTEEKEKAERPEKIRETVAKMFDKIVPYLKK